MQMTIDNPATPRLPLARPVGQPLDIKRRQTREEVVVKIPQILINRGLPHAVAWKLAGAVYDGYVKAYGGAPANADDVAKALATQKGKAALEALAAPHLAAYNAAKAAEQAKKAAEAPTPVVMAKAVVVEPRVSASTQKVLEGWLETALRLYLALDIDRRAALGDKALHIVLVRIAERCWDEGARIFDAPYVRGSEEGYAIGNLLKRMPIAGLGFEFIPKPESAPVAKAPKAPPAPKVLPPEVHDALTARLRDAMRRHRASGHNRETRHDRIIDAALRDIIGTCREHGVNSFTTPYVNGKIAPFPEGAYAMALLIGRYMALKEALEEELESFFFIGTPLAEGGLLDEEVAPVRRTNGPTITRQSKAKDGETPAQRKLRIATESRKLREAMKGTNGGGDGGKGQKKQRKSKK